MREIQVSELRGVAKRFELAANHDAVSKWAQDFFRDRAAKVRVGLESEYNDEGGYYLHPTSITVYDANDDDITDEWEAMTPSREQRLRQEWQGQGDNWKKYYPTVDKWIAEKKANIQDRESYYMTDEFSEYGFEAGDSNDEDAYEITFDLTKPFGGLPKIYVDD